MVEYTTEEVTRTIPCKLETSNRKNERLQRCINEWQEIATYFADLMPGMPEKWGNTKDTHLYRMMGRDFPDRSIMAAAAQEAYQKVVEAYGSRRSRGETDGRSVFNGGNYIRLRNDLIDIVENDQGYGVKMKLEPYTDPEWFHIDISPYTAEYIEAVDNGDFEQGSAEVHLKDGIPYLHLHITEEVDVVQPETTEHVVGVDIGERLIAATAVLDRNGDVKEVETKSGGKFRHHRDRLSDRLSRLSRQGKKSKLRDERRRYTEQVLDTTSREIVDLAAEYAPSVVAMEELTHLRETVTDPIHDMPYADLQKKIEYKAK